MAPSKASSTRVGAPPGHFELYAARGGVFEHPGGAVGIYAQSLRLGTPPTARNLVVTAVPSIGGAPTVNAVVDSGTILAGVTMLLYDGGTGLAVSRLKQGGQCQPDIGAKNEAVRQIVLPTTRCAPACASRHRWRLPPRRRSTPRSAYRTVPGQSRTRPCRLQLLQQRTRVPMLTARPCPPPRRRVSAVGVLGEAPQ